MAGNDNYFPLLSILFPEGMVLKLFLFQTLFERTNEKALRSFV